MCFIRHGWKECGWSDDWFANNLMNLFQLEWLFSIKWDEKMVMNTVKSDEGSNRFSFLAFSWTNSMKEYVRIVSPNATVWAVYLPNTSQTCHYSASFLGKKLWTTDFSTIRKCSFVLGTETVYECCIQSEKLAAIFQTVFTFFCL